ncbi:MAG: HAMP domain-containing protein [Deltaproteobacteria bacterium]|nr:HAMP domain-containing protein [Deltaproteobacteria bacterium]
MKIGITYRLFLAILIATGLAILALFLIMGWSIDRGFYQYLGRMDQKRLEQLSVNIADYYERYGNWDFLKDRSLRLNCDGMAPSVGIGLENVPSDVTGKDGFVHRPPREFRDRPPEPPDRPGMGDPSHRPSPLPPDAGRAPSPLIILDAKKEVLWGVIDKGKDVNYRPIVVREKMVGYIGLLSPKQFLHPMQIRFLSEQKAALALAASGMVLIVVLISLPLARRLVKPVRAMAAGTRDIAAGRYATRVSVKSSDELGQLARSFNDMALTLEKNEKERRQWVADISHELRTPVAVLQGEIEALLDGIRAVTPEQLKSLHAETMRLNRLINDLYQLSLSDIGALAYRKENGDIIEILIDVLESYRSEFNRKNISLTTDIPQPIKTVVYADGARLEQLFGNLLENALRYTDEGGRLTVSLSMAYQKVLIDFEDSKPGVPEKDLDRLFERLYRVEGSRSRRSGGAGLGLTLCKNIVEAHEGTISAHPSSMGGLLIRISLPLAGGSR